MKILVIDHQAHQVHEFYKSLTEAGYTLKVSNTGKEGLVDVLSFQPDLILLGQMLPYMRGNDVLKALKNNQQTAHIPVIMLSHFHDKTLVDEAMDLGATDYIAKDTIAGPDLVEKVNAIIREQHGGTGWQSIDANELL